MAADVPDEVLAAIQAVPPTENQRVHDDFLDAALAMPPQLAANLVLGVTNWVRLPYGLLFPEKAGRLITHLCRGGELDAALAVAKALLSVSPSQRSSPPGRVDEYKPTPEPATNVRDWDYGEIIRIHVPVLVDAAGERALNLLCSILNAAVKFSLHEPDAKPEDASFVWRPAIEGHEQNQPDGVKTVLVSAVRDAARTIVAADLARLQAIVELLEGRGWFIFRRLALHLLTEFAVEGVAQELVRVRLTDKHSFEEAALRHEYVALIRHGFPALTRDEQLEILGWIDAGPDLVRFWPSRELASLEGDDADRDRYVRLWTRDRLSWIGDALPEPWRQRYQDLSAAFGAPGHADFSSWTSGGWVGPTSPRTAEELGSTPAVEVVKFLRQWRPSEDDFMAPSREGLGRELAGVVAGRPAPYAFVANDFRGLDPTYVRALMTGLRQAVIDGRPFDWEPVLAFARLVVSSPWAIVPGASHRLERDVDWSPTNQSIAELLSSGFEAADGVPLALRGVAWDVLFPITNDSEPTPDYEAKYGGSNTDPATMSINTARGVALHAVIRYALWIRREIDRAESDSNNNAGFIAMREVRSVLERHLDTEIEPSVTVRAVYGQWLPWLILLDESWTRSNLTSIFPPADDGRILWDAAWETYIFYSRFFTNVFNVIRDEYELAVDRLGSANPAARRRLDPDERLAEHLMIVYWQGYLVLDEAGGLLNRFFDHASARVRRHALSFVGRSLRPNDDGLDQTIQDRLRALWDHRFAVASASQKGEAIKELAGFGSWYAAGLFEPTWAMSQLLAVLRLEVRPEPDNSVLEEVAKNASTMPSEALECLRRFAELDKEGWHIHVALEHAYSIVAAALSSGDAAARSQAVDLINWFGARGISRFRDLL